MLMSLTFKNFAASLLLASFLLVALFGFVAMSSGSDGRMEGGCPFSATGAAFCPQDATAVLHHIGAYFSFLNVPAGSATLALMSALLFAVALLMLLVRPLLFQIIAYGRRFNNSPPVSVRTHKITRWLSLLEHSPSML